MSYSFNFKMIIKPLLTRLASAALTLSLLLIVMGFPSKIAQCQNWSMTISGVGGVSALGYNNQGGYYPKLNGHWNFAGPSFVAVLSVLPVSAVVCTGFCSAVKPFEALSKSASVTCR